VPKLNLKKGNYKKNRKENTKSVNMTFCIIAKISTFCRIHCKKANNSQ